MTTSRPILMWRGDFHRPCGFTHINRQLAPRVDDRGFDVHRMPLDGPPPGRGPDRAPDVYLFHGDPADMESAPGELNAYFLQWEYRRVPAEWVEALHRRFDVVVAPSAASREVYRSSCVELPIVICPGAFDRRRIHPLVPPLQVATAKRFRFAHLGGAHPRRGTDVLLRAYFAEFSSRDDVALILKPFHYLHHRSWLHGLLRSLDRPDAPELVYLEGDLEEVGGVFTAAHIGVYPLRAECCGLPVLECIASGRPVIVPRGTGLDDFCTPENSLVLRAGPGDDPDREGLEPDEAHLRELMRSAYERGELSPQRRARIADTVAAFTWERSAGRLAEGLREVWEDRGRRRTRPGPSIRHRRPVPSTALGMLEDPIAYLLREGDGEIVGSGGPEGWPFPGGHPTGALHSCPGGMAAADLEAVSRVERALCRVSPRPPDPFASWRERLELGGAQTIAVRTWRAAVGLVEAGATPRAIVRVPPVSERWRRLRPSTPSEDPPWALFVSGSPFRDGLRLLLDSWARVRPRGWHLRCSVHARALESHEVLRRLVRDPSVDVEPGVESLGPRDLVDHIDRCSLVVHPTLLDGWGEIVVAAMSRGRPTIVSTACAMVEHVHDGKDGLVFEAGSVESLAAALARAMADADQARRVGEAAARRSEAWTSEAFRRRVETREPAAPAR